MAYSQLREIEVTINSFEDKVIISIKDNFISVDEKYKSLYLIDLSNGVKKKNDFIIKLLSIS